LDESLQETPILHSSSLMSRRVLPSVVLLAVSGWREIAALLRLAPPAPRTLELMTLAMDRHPRALVPTFQEVLARFPPEEAMSWIAPLLEGNQQRQCIAVDIAVALAPHCDAMLGFTLRSLAGLVSGRAASEIVRQRVGRALAELPAAPAHSAEMEKIAVMADLRSLPEPNLRITPVRFLETPILSRDAGRRWSDAKPRQSGIWPVDARPGVKWVGSLGKMTTSTSLKQNHKFQPHASQPRLPGLPRLMKPVEHGLRGGVMTV
jgi:hypothetical protein